MSDAPFHVIIIGGGIGGLCLAQGLKKAGVSVAVYERDRTAAARLQGYRIHINPNGSRALHACLPPHLYDAFLSTCGQASKRFGFYTEQMEELLSICRSENGGEPDPVRSHKSVSRMTLRQVLLAEMDDIVHFDKKFECYQEGQEGKITAFFADGTSATGDMLVAADGGNSRVRQQFLPHAKRIDTGILIIAGKLLLTQETRRLLPTNLLEGPASVVAPKGLGMFVAVQEFVHDPKDVIYSIGGNSCEKQSSLLFENTKDHILWQLIARREKYPFQKDVTEADGCEMQKAVLAMIEDWDPRFQSLVRMSDPSTITPLPIHSSVPIQPWETKTVTLVGDAIHSMTPMRGIGANTALRDAELLCENVISAHRGEKSLLQAIRDYENKMVQYGFDAVRSSMKAAQQSTSENAVALAVMKRVFRLIQSLPPIKRLLFRNYGNG
ncbi:FAD-dependent oxidoreductase [Brevibacillus choshinensis]|uniref:FAD-dependent oxidoreductase n=1 Tax=Brevibacillus choshinensis TaxID=54911 RepID=UPI002E1C2D45|nr:FAD-dependent monooxygenase [Brevibacillus choshinensis]MED4780243.1 FAD-dependent monooxygenase [Brevibacillus choshinensis]